MRSNISADRDAEIERLRNRCDDLEEERLHLEKLLEAQRASVKQKSFEGTLARTESESEAEDPEQEDLAARCQRLEAEKEKLQKHVERLWQMCEALDAGKPEEQCFQGRQGSLEEINFEAVVEHAVSAKENNRLQLAQAEAEKSELQVLVGTLHAQIRSLEARVASEEQETTIGAVARCEELTRQKAEVEKELGELANAYAELQGNLHTEKKLKMEAEAKAVEARAIQETPAPEVASLVCKLKRLRILGCCAAGKSNLRKCLAEVLQLPAVEMDSIYWKLGFFMLLFIGWVMRHPDETLDLLTQRTQEDAWIVDGNFMSKPRDLDRSELNRWLWEKTQCVVWLDYPFWTIYLRAWRRTLWRISSGEPCCNGNRETWSLLLCDFRNSIPYFVWTTHAQLAQRVQQLEHIFEGKLHFAALAEQKRLLLEAQRSHEALGPTMLVRILMLHFFAQRSGQRSVENGWASCGVGPGRMMVPNGLTCKNTFFDIPEDDADLPEGPATCPPASDGWWPSSSSSRLGSDGPSWPSSPAFFDLPTLGETDQTVLNTPDPWMDSLVHRFGEPLAPNNGSYGATPSPPLMTPDWFERMPMKTSERFPFDPVVGKMTASTPDGRSSSGRSPPSENNSTIARQTPDPFEDTPSPVEASYGRSPSRFDQLLAAEVGRSGDASERSPQRQAM
eukprot:symbB.v1.2.038930.t1/scaffold6247.1/size28174/1